MAEDELHDLQEQIFELVRRSQEAMLDATRVFTDRLAAAVPGDPTPVDDLIDRAYDLTERVLRVQRDLAKTVLEAVTVSLAPDRDAARDPARDAEGGDGGDDG